MATKFAEMTYDERKEVLIGTQCKCGAALTERNFGGILMNQTGQCSRCEYGDWRGTIRSLNTAQG